jgi:hypothetical protein
MKIQFSQALMKKKNKKEPGYVINPDGTLTTATHVGLVPNGSGVKTAYPVTLETLPN